MWNPQHFVANQPTNEKIHTWPKQWLQLRFLGFKTATQATGEGVVSRNAIATSPALSRSSEPETSPLTWQQVTGVVPPWVWGSQGGRLTLTDLTGGLVRAMLDSKSCRAVRKLFRCLHTGIVDNTWGWRCLSVVGGSDTGIPATDVSSVAVGRQGGMPEGLLNVTVSHNLHCSPSDSECSVPTVVCALGCWKKLARTCFSLDRSPSRGLSMGKAGQRPAWNWYQKGKKKKGKEKGKGKQIHSDKVSSKSWRTSKASPLLGISQ